MHEMDKFLTKQQKFPRWSNARCLYVACVFWYSLKNNNNKKSGEIKEDKMSRDNWMSKKKYRKEREWLEWERRRGKKEEKDEPKMRK